ncbi:DUF6193 family natural product biosynthesis protein [Actinosynnema sp. CS-041913]|uniref:DUF6193 family natural product biosynthesis protein n=1 Tax=Actinosynnema sp. CS-041913 TaxID=3239917 RepID=UPI003D8BA06F
MKAAEWGSPVDWSFYPDVARVFSLRVALQSELDRLGRGLAVRLPAAPGWRDTGAVVRHEDRRVDVGMGIQERVFLMRFRVHDVELASGTTSDLAAVAGSIATWTGGALVRDLSAAWPFAQFSPWSEAYERGEGIEWRWQRYVGHRGLPPHLTALRPFLVAAMGQPRLRALYPFTSMYTLGFRPTIRYVESDGPWVQSLDDGRFRVRGRGGKEVGVDDADHSVTLALAVLDTITYK